jgi:hypothetical protein
MTAEAGIPYFAKFVTLSASLQTIFSHTSENHGQAIAILDAIYGPSPGGSQDKSPRLAAAPVPRPIKRRSVKAIAKRLRRLVGMCARRAQEPVTWLPFRLPGTRPRRVMLLSMDVTRILEELRTERAHVEEAILALERLVVSHGKRRGRPPAWMKAMADAPKRRGRPPGSKNKSQEIT